MQSKVMFAYSIDASHEGGLPPMVCGDHLHGHEWEIRATFLYDPLQDTSFPRNTFDDTLEELDERHLNDMIRPSQATTYGLAHWLMARWASTTRIESVSVTVNGDSSIVENDQVRRK